MTQDSENPSPERRGVLLRARNGDVIGFDQTGLTLNLADSVIENIQSRLDRAQFTPVDPAVLGDIQAWDVKEYADWYLFHARLPGAQPVGHFRRAVSGHNDMPPSIIADPMHAFFGLLSLGGARRGLSVDLPINFPYHVLSCDDDMGALGPAGTQEVEELAAVGPLREHCRDSLLAEEIIQTRMDAYRALPVIYARMETDSSSSMSALKNGPAMKNFAQSTANFCAAAKSMNLPAKVLAVGLDFTLEAVEDTQASWLSGLYDILAQISDLFADHGLRKPLFVAQFEAGTQFISDHPVLRAQWELAWNTAGHEFVFSAPSYMFALDEFGRATPQAQIQMAEMDAQAIEACNHDQPWACPVFLLAEREDDPSIIRVRAQGIQALLIDPNDPFEAGDSCGFQLKNCTNDAKILRVEIAQNDPQDLCIFFDKAPEGEDLKLLYALGHPLCDQARPANRGRLRDLWEFDSKTGAKLHRWALPCALKVN